jgi:PHP family Zn ribbon phosphoesterase
MVDWSCGISHEYVQKETIYCCFVSTQKNYKHQFVCVHAPYGQTPAAVKYNVTICHQEWIKQEIENAVANESNLSKSDLKRLIKHIWELECRL